MGKNSRRVLALFILFIMLFTLVPSSSIFVMAEEEESVVSDSVATLDDQMKAIAEEILEDLSESDDEDETVTEEASYEFEVDSEDEETEEYSEENSEENSEDETFEPSSEESVGDVEGENSDEIEVDISEEQTETTEEEQNESETESSDKKKKKKDVETEETDDEAEKEVEELPEEEKEYQVPAYTAEIKGFVVSAVTTNKAFDVPVTLVASMLSENEGAYKEAVAALNESGKEFDGMLALDIHFEDEYHQEVEPNRPVNVSIKVKKNAIKTVVKDTSLVIPETVEVNHITSDDAGNTSVDTVASFAGTSEGSVAVTTGLTAEGKSVEQINSSFMVDGFSTYTITWTNSEEEEEKVTIHWGYYEGSTFNEFTSTTTVDSSAASVDLAVNVDGYYYVGAEYKETESADPVNMGSSVLKKSGDTWTIETVTTGEDGKETTVTTSVVDGSHIYVNYASKDSGSYTPPSPPSGSAESIAPETTKKVTKNSDGTYTIELSVEGHEDQTVEKIGANVIIVMDITQSMTSSISGGSTRMAAAKSALNTLISTLNPGTGEDQNLINFAAVNFGNDNDYTLARTWTSTRSQMEAYVSGLPSNPTDMGTCWQAGLRGGNVLAVEAQTNDDLKNNKTYVLFLTDGNPNCYANNDDGSGQWHGAQNANFSQAAYNASLNNAVALAGNSNLYGVFVGDAAGLEHLTDLITYAGGVQVINGNTASNMEEAFKSIAQTIVNDLGASNVTVDDGIPSLSNVSANVTAGEAGGFEYYITPAGESQEKWDDAPGATYDETNGVTWDLGEAGSLKEGWIYTLKFKVWPSQEAYDTIADLNNGLITMSDEELAAAGIEKKSDGTYILNTNTHLVTTFTDPNGNVYEEVEEDVTSEAMELPTETITVQKIWNNLLDQKNPPSVTLKLVLNKDGEAYLSGDDAIAVSSATNWKKDNIFISVGQITKNSDGYEIIETGHDYEIVEPEEYEGSYRWELTSEVYHPMVINGKSTMLIKDDEATGTDGTDYYTIDGTKYKVASGSSVLQAWNDRRSWLQLEKKVTGSGAPTDAMFEFTVTINDAEEQDIWFSAYGPDGIVKDLETSATAEDGNTGYFYSASGSAITMKIQAGWTVRFLNLPSGTTYTIEEGSLPDGFAFKKAEGDTVVDTEADQDEPSEVEVDGETVSGEINVPNVEFYVYYTNEYKETSVKVTKEWDDEDDLDEIRPDSVDIKLLTNGEETDSVTLNEDSEWTYTWKKLPYYIDGEEAEYNVEEVETDVITGEDGEGTYAYEVSGDAEKGFTVTNTHTSKGVVIIDPPVKKVIKGTAPSPAEKYTFKLEAGDASYPMPDAAKGKSSMTMTITGAGSGEFGEIKIKEAGEYTYTVTEVAGKNANCEYDSTVYTVTAIVTVGDDGKLVAERKYTKDGKDVDIAEFEFVNKYNTPPTPPTPPTGDTTNIALWGALLASSVLGIAGIITVIRRKKEDE